MELKSELTVCLNLQIIRDRRPLPLMSCGGRGISRAEMTHFDLIIASARHVAAATLPLK
jgi:hypothetical protein